IATGAPAGFHLSGGPLVRPELLERWKSMRLRIDASRQGQGYRYEPDRQKRRAARGVDVVTPEKLAESFAQAEDRLRFISDGLKWIADVTRFGAEDAKWGPKAVVPPEALADSLL